MAVPTEKIITTWGNLVSDLEQYDMNTVDTAYEVEINLPDSTLVILQINSINRFIKLKVIGKQDLYFGSVTFDEVSTDYLVSFDLENFKISTYGVGGYGYFEFNCSELKEIKLPKFARISPNGITNAPKIERVRCEEEAFRHIVSNTTTGLDRDTVVNFNIFIPNKKLPPDSPIKDTENFYYFGLEYDETIIDDVSFNLNEFFSSAKKLKTLDISKWNFQIKRPCRDIFRYNKSIERIYGIENILRNASDIFGAFGNFDGDWSKVFDTDVLPLPSVNSVNQLFYRCFNTTKICLDFDENPNNVDHLYRMVINGHTEESLLEHFEIRNLQKANNPANFFKVNNYTKLKNVILINSPAFKSLELTSTNKQLKELVLRETPITSFACNDFSPQYLECGDLSFKVIAPSIKPNTADKPYDIYIYGVISRSGPGYYIEGTGRPDVTKDSIGYDLISNHIYANLSISGQFSSDVEFPFSGSSSFSGGGGPSGSYINYMPSDNDYIISFDINDSLSKVQDINNQKGLFAGINCLTENLIDKLARKYKWNTLEAMFISSSTETEIFDMTKFNCQDCKSISQVFMRCLSLKEIKFPLNLPRELPSSGALQVVPTNKSLISCRTYQLHLDYYKLFEFPSSSKEYPLNVTIDDPENLNGLEPVYSDPDSPTYLRSDTVLKTSKNLGTIIFNNKNYVRLSFLPGTVKSHCLAHLFDCIDKPNSNLDSGTLNDSDYLLSVDFTGVDFSNVTNMEAMIHRCDNLKSLTWGKNCHTENVKSFKHLVSDCVRLEEHDIENIRTDSCTNFSFMFWGNISMKQFRVENFDVRKGLNFRNMFRSVECDEIDLSNWYTRDCNENSITYDFGMYVDTGLGQFNSMFYMAKIKKLDLSGIRFFDGAVVTSFFGSKKVTYKPYTQIDEIYFNNWSNAGQIFNLLDTPKTYIKKIIFTEKEFPEPRYANNLVLANYTNLEELDVIALGNYLTGLNLVADSKITSLDLTKNINITDLNLTATGVERVDLSNNSKLTNCNGALSNCSNLKEVWIPTLLSIPNKNNIFSGCPKLEKIHINKFEEHKVVPGSDPWQFITVDYEDGDEKIFVNIYSKTTSTDNFKPFKTFEFDANLVTPQMAIFGIVDELWYNNNSAITNEQLQQIVCSKYAFSLDPQKKVKFTNGMVIAIANPNNYVSNAPVAGTVMYDRDLILSDNDKKRARRNIAAVGYDVDQDLTDEEKLNARNNIDATKVNDSVTNTTETWSSNKVKTELDKKLNTSGGTLTGNISYKGTKQTYQMIRFVDNTADTNGNGISIGGGGVSIIGGGESATNIQNESRVVGSGGDEKMIIANDGVIQFYTNCQNGIYDANNKMIATETYIDKTGHFSGTAGSKITNIFDGNANSADYYFQLKDSIDNYSALIVIGQAYGNEQAVSLIIPKEYYYYLPSSFRNEFIINGSISGTTRRLYFGFQSTNPSILYTGQIAGTSGNMPSIKRIYGIA